MRIDPDPLPSGFELSSLILQAPDPPSQEMGRLELGREDPAASSDKSVHTKSLSPVSEILISEVFQKRCPESLWMGPFVPCRKPLICFRVGQIESTSPCDKEFPPYGRFAFIQGHVDARRRKDLSSPQASWTTTHNSYTHGLYRSKNYFYPVVLKPLAMALMESRTLGRSSSALAGLSARLRLQAAKVLICSSCSTAKARARS